MWRELIACLDAEAKYHPPATPDDLAALETALGAALPPELAALLQETNGVEVAYVNIVWSTGEIAARNAEMRRDGRRGGWLESYMPVDSLLFFGDVGNGDLLAFPITPAGVRRQVFVWNHEDDSRTCEAPSLSEWLRVAECD